MTSIHFAATPRDRVIDIGDGLIMRWSTNADADHIADVVGESFKWLLHDGPEGVTPPPNEMLISGAKRLLSGKNACMAEYDYAIVEDLNCESGKNPIAACAALHRVRAYYGCVNLLIGKPELIATQNCYRNKGLVRRLMFEMIHPESEAREDDMQFIPGIPHFYRQFGYEYGLTSFNPSKIANIQTIPTLATGDCEPFVLRLATPDDIPYLISKSANEIISPYTQVGLCHGPEYWYWSVRDLPMVAKTKYDCERETRIVVNSATGKDVGFTVVSHIYELSLELFALDEDVFVQDAIYPILRQLIAIHKERLKVRKAQEKGSRDTELIDTTSFHMLLQLHPNHPAIALLGSKLSPPANTPGYRMYARINDYPRFIQKIIPELEIRLVHSPMAGTTGILRLDFYRKVLGNKSKGLEIIFNKGKIVSARDWSNPGHEVTVEEYLAWKVSDNIPHVYAAAFAPLTFNTLLLGDRSLNDLEWSYGETVVKDNDTRILLNTLFPKTSHHFDIPMW
ncbi:hypothetical protein BGZ49_009417 [Haplosporangium sp. Z 27]|nr:hypothetical protein BGZ49_009417 [Haplosporangium sp. Z 27]